MSNSQHKWPRVCLFCKHFDIYFGEHPYSRDTPGGPGHIYCEKDWWDDSTTPYSGRAVAQLVQRGVDCPDFEDSEPDSHEFYENP